MSNLDEYFKTRYNGAYFKNPNRELFILKRSDFIEEDMLEFANMNKLCFPDSYIKYLKQYNGHELDMKVTFNVTKPEIISVIPLILPFNSARDLYNEIQSIKKLKKAYFPIALSSCKNCDFYIKVSVRNKGWIYTYDNIMDEVILCCHSVEEFLKSVNVEI